MKLRIIPSGWRRSIQCLLPLLFLVSFITALEVDSLQVIAQQPRQEIRGVWLTSNDFNTLKNRTKLQNAITQLRRLNFNTIYPVVWNSGYTSYPSAVAKKIGIPFFDRGSEGQDILADVIAQAHRQGLLAIPWFEFGFMAPPTSELALNRPNWLT
ncbi:MAG: family 10 glycosylhydrolase, partial [Tolypothrix sp. Co-bin9]|nr:family 10 glycosylhydrolase [Tolypothrix sp. Co-bin9]